MKEAIRVDLQYHNSQVILYAFTMNKTNIPIIRIHKIIPGLLNFCYAH